MTVVNYDAERTPLLPVPPLAELPRHKQVVFPPAAEPGLVLEHAPTPAPIPRDRLSAEPARLGLVAAAQAVGRPPARQPGRLRGEQFPASLARPLARLLLADEAQLPPAQLWRHQLMALSADVQPLREPPHYDLPHPLLGEAHRREIGRAS